MDVVEEEGAEHTHFGLQKMAAAVDEIDEQVDEHFNKALGMPREAGRMWRFKTDLFSF